VRNLSEVTLELSPTINIFYGDNGSGKTSLLESIALLGLGRSFRSHKTRSLIAHNQKQLVVFALLNTQGSLNPLPLGLQKERSGSTNIKLEGNVVKAAATLAKQLPLQIINANSFQLIEGAPGQRRQFLDWLVFHVKPNFIVVWKDLQKVLKHRNTLLRRDKIDYAEFTHWDKEFVRLALDIHTMRQETFTDLKECFGVLSEEFLGHNNILLSYLAGWDTSVPFNEVLEDSFERDKRDGYTHYGPQRANIAFNIEGKIASDVLSRGQEKSLVCALHIAQAMLYQRAIGEQCVFLVDDLPSELDTKHRALLAKWLSSLNGQVFVTGVEKQDLINAWSNENKQITLFHVKQGEIKQDNDSQSQQKHKSG